MSFFSYLEIHPGTRPIVKMGNTNARALATEVRRPGALLRIYAPDDSDPGQSTLDVFLRIQNYMKNLARPRSAVRESLVLFLPHHGDDRLFFRASLPDLSKVEPFLFTSWKELETWTKRAAGPVLLLEADGPRAELQKLLDAINASASDDPMPHDPDVAFDPSPPDASTDDRHQAAIDFRNELLARNWPDGKRVAQLAGAQIGANPNQYAARQRAQGSLLGVWSASARSFLHPEFQFDPTGNIRPEVAELLKILPANDDGGWRRAFWLYSPHALLEGKKPAEVFKTDPQKVIDVAEREFNGDQDAGW